MDLGMPGTVQSQQDIKKVPQELNGAVEDKARPIEFPHGEVSI